MRQPLDGHNTPILIKIGETTTFNKRTYDTEADKHKRFFENHNSKGEYNEHRITTISDDHGGKVQDKGSPVVDLCENSDDLIAPQWHSDILAERDNRILKCFYPFCASLLFDC